MRSEPRRSRQRRGSAYVLVLGSAMIVTILGLSALTAVRVERRVAQAAESAVLADHAARSAVELGVLLIARQENWRKIYSNDTWIPLGELADATIEFKLVDEVDGSLGNDWSQPVRLYGKGLVGEAMREYSVVLAAEGGSGASNLLTNPGFETGVNRWRGDYCTTVPNLDAPHGGTKCLKATNRTAWYAGPAQDVAGVVRSGASYDVECWARTESGTDDVRIYFYIDAGSGSTWYLVGSGTVGADDWTKVSGSVTASWSGELHEAIVRIMASSGTGDFSVDDAVMSEVGGTPAESGTLAVVSGTWRREVEETVVQLCSESCGWARDGVCDDGGAGSVYSDCAYGTDCTDCGPRDPL